MANDDPLSLFLLRWQEIYEGQGRDAPAGELCRDRPELETELQRQIDILKQMGDLAGSTHVEPVSGPDAPKTRTLPPATPVRLPTAPGRLPTWVHHLLDPSQDVGEAGRLGRFRIIRMLGEGGMGAVLLAEDPVADRRVALKVLKPALLDRADARARFLREARAAAKLEHENVVPVYHVDEVKGIPYIVMPLLQGENLEDRLKREPRPPLALTLQVGREAAEGLAAAHDAGLIHRDVKPANLWLEALPRGGVRVRVLDFGLARPLEAGEPITESGAVLGTPAYMSPEQASGEKLRPTSDLFSLGAVLYRMATGRHAFDGPTLPALLRNVAETQPPAPRELWPELPGALSDLIMALLAKNQAGRPTSARSVADALAGLESGKPLPAPPDTLERPRPLPKWRWLLWVGGAALAAALLLAVFLGPRVFPQGNGGGGDTHSGPAALTGELTVRIGSAKGLANNRGGLRVQDANALPLGPAEGFRVAVKLSAPAYVYLVWIDRDGDVVPLYPWNPGDETTEMHLRVPPPKLPPKTAVYSPPDGDSLWHPQGESGLETILLLARSEPLGADVNLADLIGKLPPTPLAPDHPREVILRGLDRGRQLPPEDRERRPDARALDEPFERMLERLGQHFEVVRAVRFGFKN